MGRRLAVAILILGLMTSYYLASPLLAAFQLRQAIVSGDTKAIAGMVNWPSLRASIRRTVSQNANLLPAVKVVTKRGKPTWWQRIRSAFGRSMLENFIERYITPDGLVRLYRTKTKLHERAPASVRRLRPMDNQSNPSSAQISKAWRRVQSAVFVTPFLFQLDMQDRHKPTRMIKSTFQLTSITWRGLQWTLTAIAVRTIDPRKETLARLNGF